MAQFVEMAHVLKVDIKDLLEANFDYSDKEIFERQ